MAGADNAVVARNIFKNYGDVQALENLSLEFPRGQLTSILGPSGCGKTTLLKIIAGLLAPSAGEIEVNGQAVTGPGPDRAFVFQDFALLPWASVVRNVAFGLELRGVAKSEREGIAEKYIRDVGLNGFENSYPHELSGGMRQRVGLARALSVDSQVLLMDEPFSAVDEQTRRKFQEDLLALVQNENKTFIFVTHSIEGRSMFPTRSRFCCRGQAGCPKSSARLIFAPKALKTSDATPSTWISSMKSGPRCEPMLNRGAL